MLELYRAALRLRRTLPGEDLEWVDSAPATLSFLRRAADGTVLGCVVNLGSEPVDLPAYDEVLLASQPLDGDRLPSDAAVWLRLP